MKQNQNVIIAVVLSFLVILGWQHFVIGPKLEAERARQAAEQARATDAAPGTVTGSQAAATGAASAPAAGGPTAAATVATAPAAPGGSGDQSGGQSGARTVVKPRADVLAAEQRVAIDTPALKGSINLKGARFDDLLLADYHVTIDPTSPLVELFSPVGTEHPYYAEFGWVAGAGGPAVPGADTLWTAEGGPLGPGRDVTLTWDNGAGLLFRRVVSVDDKYMFTIRQSVENRTASPVALYPFGLVNRIGLPLTSNYYILHEGPIGYLEGDGLQEINYHAGGLPFLSKRNLEKEPSIEPAKTSQGWLGITDKYWAAALVPASGAPFQPRFLKGGTTEQPSFQSDYLADAVSVPAGGTAGAESRLFAGAKATAILDRYQRDLKIPQFDLLIDWGWFFFITKPMFKLIDWLYQHIGNFGVSILLVTVIVKAIFFPLASKSYASMSKMKKLQPEMQAIQARHKDDRMAMQQAMMELYKTQKVNPVAGCWPVLIQIPVFFSLYKTLFVTIEMRHAPFFGWIQDLSAPDPTNIFTLFGLIPWSPPHALHLGIWPIVMGFTMFVQMRMNPTPPDKTQAMIFNWMPVIFTFMLGSFPAGLVIYWAWNNTLSVLQQGLIMKRHGVPIELFGNLKGTFARPKPKDSPAE